MTDAHTLDIRVYYEDTDMAGIVYYANYLRYVERGRSAMVREYGVDQMKMRDETDTVFAVQHVDATYHKPARLDDLLTVETKVQQSGPARTLWSQRVVRGPDLLFSCEITVICMSLAGKPKRLPAEFREKML